MWGLSMAPAAWASRRKRTFASESARSWSVLMTLTATRSPESIRSAS